MMQRCTWNHARAVSAALGLQQVRHSSSIPHSKAGMMGFDDKEFNNYANHFLELVEDKMDEVADQESSVEVVYGDGVLSIETRVGTFVLNKQAPNMQLWLSSPISGPHHYDMVRHNKDQVQWKSDRDGHDLREKLEKEMKESTEVAVSFAA